METEPRRKMKLLKVLNDENITQEEIQNFKHRRAVRVIVFDKENNIVIIHAEVNDYYELPGGGVEEYETLVEGAIREAKEETGADIKIKNEVGIVKEYLKEKNLVNETFCYKAEVIKEKEGLNLMQDEIERGMKVLWVSVDEAIRLINTNKSESQYATPMQVKYTQVRDLTFLKEI
jgi:8-oxo-dGTP diphosphatase